MPGTDMAETLAELQAQLERLNAARAGGVRSIAYVANGVSRTVEWKTDKEMAAAQADLQRRIAALQGGGSRVVRISSSKGLDSKDL